MSEYTNYKCVIEIASPEINLSHILEYAPVGSEGGLIFTKLSDYSYASFCGLRNQTLDNKTIDTIDYWLENIENLVEDLLLEVHNIITNTTLIYYKNHNTCGRIIKIKNGKSDEFKRLLGENIRKYEKVYCKECRK